MRASGAQRLLDAFPLGKDGKGSKASDWWTRYRNRNLHGFAEAGRVFHSFRTTHGTRAKTVGVNPQLLKQWFGHADGEKDDLTEAYYNTGQQLAMLSEEISRVYWEVEAIKKLSRGWRELLAPDRRRI